MSCDIFIPLSLKDDERNLIDREIAELEKRLQVLRARRNRLSPTALLPPELLTRIFSLVQDRDFYWKAYEWTAVTQVCHSWRTVALSTSTLWNNIVYSSDGAPRAPQSAALAALHRSGKCKIDVNIIQSYTLLKDLSLIFTVLADLSRIRTLRLSVQAEAHCVGSLEFHKLAVFLRTPAPVLEELTLTSFILMPNEDETALRLGFEDDIIWFNGVSPQLHSIALNYPPSDLAGVHSQHLTSLELRSLAAEIAYKQYISIVLPIDTHPTFSGLDILPLSHLRILHFAQSQKDHDCEIFRWCYTLDRPTDLALEAEFVDFFLDFAKEEIVCFPALKSLSTWLSHRDEAYQIRVLDSLHGFLDQRASFTTPMKLQRLSVANLGVYEEPISGRIHKFKGLVRGMEAGGQILW